MDTFLEKFEAYHELMAYGGLSKEKFEENIKDYPRSKYLNDYDYFINDNHMEVFKTYLSFLNEIPTDKHMEEVDNLFCIFMSYSANYREYDITYANTYDETENRNISNMSNKRKSDIKIAKKFRDSLHGDNLTISDPFSGRSLPVNDFMDNKRMYRWTTERYTRLKIAKNLSRMSELEILVSSLTLYIDDLEKKEYKIRSEKDYQNFSPKASTEYLINHIKEVAKKYNISDTSSSIKTFKKYLNTYKHY